MESGYLAIADAVRKVDDQFPTDKDFIQQIKFIRDTFKSTNLPQNFKSIQDGYAEVKDSLATKNAKIVISLDSFEQQLQQYMQLSQAAKYRDLMRDFVGACQSRNNKQIDYTRCLLAAAEAKSQVEGLKPEADRIQGILVPI